MSILIHSVYDSTDAAELAVMRLKRNVKGVRVAGVSRRVMPDNSEETVLFSVPSGTNYSVGDGMMGPTYGAPFLFSSVQNSRFEPAQRRDVSLKVETTDERSAAQAESILRSTGGREIRRAAR